MARTRGFLRGRSGTILEDLLSRVVDILPDGFRQGPALLHGDLWSGNFYADGAGRPVLIDPAVYRGAGEVDLAMMELFGSLPEEFREGYEEIRPIPGEYLTFLRDLYQLYYLLVHVNLFGGSYEGSSVMAARRVLSAT
jgi:fructosamine-3-kinase